MTHKKTFWIKAPLIICFATLTGCATLTPPSTSQSLRSTTSAATSAPTTIPATVPLSLPTTEPVQASGKQINGQYASLWDVIRSGYTMNHYYTDPRVQIFISQYTHNPTFLENITTQSIPYMYTIVSMIQERNMPTELALLPIVESSYQPNARSYCGALGIWQLMPAAAKRFNANENYWFNGRKSVIASTGAALDYLKYLYNYFNGDWYLALAAYNAGEGTVQKAQRYNAARGLPTDFWDLRLPQATENYVPQLLALAIIINDSGHYGINLPPIANKPIIAAAA